MPLYEYECRNGHRSERILHISEFVEEIVCDECRKAFKKNKKYSESLARLVVSRTGPPVLKKGIGGFYSPTCD